MAIDLRAYPNRHRADAIDSARKLQRDADDDTVFAVAFRGLFERPNRVVRYTLPDDAFPRVGLDGVLFVARLPSGVIQFPRIERAPVPIEVAAQIAVDGWAA